MTSRIERHRRTVRMLVAASLLALMALAKALVVCHHHDTTELAFGLGHDHAACGCASEHTCSCCGASGRAGEPGEAVVREHCDCGCETDTDDPVRLEPGVRQSPPRTVDGRGAATAGGPWRLATSTTVGERPRFATGPPPPRIAKHLRLHATNVLML